MLPGVSTVYLFRKPNIQLIQFLAKLNSVTGRSRSDDSQRVSKSVSESVSQSDRDFTDVTLVSEHTF